MPAAADLQTLELKRLEEVLVNRNVGSILAAALAVAALAAPAAPAAPVKAKPVRDLGSIKRELWAAEAGVETAAASLRGLQAIAFDSQAYEPVVATQLRDRAERILLESEQHLSKLWKVPGQDDATLRKVASLQDAVRRLRERVQKLGQPTRAQIEPRPDPRRGAGAGEATADAGAPEVPGHKPDGGSMPPPGSEAILDVRAELKTVDAELALVEAEARKLTEHYGIADELHAR
jgi:hypothetical protein